MENDFLKEISVQDLIDEISSRFEACIICGIRKSPDREGIDDYKYHFNGCRATDIGLCEMLIDKIKRTV